MICRKCLCFIRAKQRVATLRGATVHKSAGVCSRNLAAYRQMVKERGK